MNTNNMSREEVKDALKEQRVRQAAEREEMASQPCAIEDALDRAELDTGKRPMHIHMVCTCPRCRNVFAAA